MGPSSFDEYLLNYCQLIETGYFYEDYFLASFSAMLTKLEARIGGTPASCAKDLDELV